MIDIKRSTFLVGLHVIKLIDTLPKTTASIAISKQIVRSATSVGANYRSACRGKSRADFIAKLKIVEEEADETQYWLDMLQASGLAREVDLESLKQEVKVVLAVIVSAIKSSRER